MSEEKRLSDTTITLMIVTALFFDFSQWVFAFVLLDWLVGFFAFMTFLVWFWMYGIKFMKPKRLFAFGGATIAELIPLVAALPAWTAAVAYLALSARLQEKLPMAAVAALKVGAAAKGGSVSAGKDFKPEVSQKPIPEINRSMEVIKRRSLDNTKAQNPSTYPSPHPSQNKI